MKKLLTYVLGVCLIIPCCFWFTGCKDNPSKPTIEAWDGSTIEVSTAVDGVIEIETAEELAGLAEEVKQGNNFEDITIKLTCDMDLCNREWTPIGFGSSGGSGIMDGNSMIFAGNFDGQNHAIYNLKITNFVGGGLEINTASGVGLFGHISGEVKNVKVQNAVVKANHFVGAVVGFASGAEIENCHVVNANVSCEYANEDESGDKAGAVVGHVQNHAERNASIRNCTANNSRVDADRDAGTILGCLSTNNYNTGTIASESDLRAESVQVNYNETGKGESSKSGNNISNLEIGRDER